MSLGLKRAGLGTLGLVVTLGHPHKDVHQAASNPHGIQDSNQVRKGFNSCQYLEQIQIEKKTKKIIKSLLL